MGRLRAPVTSCDRRRPATEIRTRNTSERCVPNSRARRGTRRVVLKTATSNVAYAYKRRNLGSLDVGKIGDLVILDADPLQSTRNYRRINAVIKDGKVIDLDTLPTAPVISAKTKS